MEKYGLLRKILVVEDNEGDFMLIEDYLREHIANPDIYRTPNLEETRKFLIENTPEIILLDLSLPDRSGEPLIEEVLQLMPDVPVLVLTGNMNLELGMRSLAKGVSDYLIKDEITGPALFKSILYSLERKKVSAELKRSEKKHSEVFHLSPQPMWVYDRETLRFMDVNQAAISHYGYTREEFLSRTIRDIRPPQDLPLLEEALRTAPNKAAGYSSGVFTHQKKNGEMLLVEISSNEIEFNGRASRIVVAADVTEKTRLEKALMVERENRHKEITEAVLMAQEKERQGIGQELHDNINQILATANLYLSLVRNQQEEGNPMLQKAEMMIKSAIYEIRQLSHSLISPFFKDSGLLDALETAVEAANTASDTLYEYDWDEFNENGLPESLKLALYRIVQEQLQNIVKYAHASQVKIRLSRDPYFIRMRIVDNRIGFDPSIKGKGVGLRNMQTRAALFSGTAAICSTPGKGCCLEIEIPLAHNQKKPG